MFIGLNVIPLDRQRWIKGMKIATWFDFIADTVAKLRITLRKPLAQQSVRCESSHVGRQLSKRQSERG
jgi:hypothetical protein